MSKPLEITLRPYNPSHSDYDSPAGELRPGNYTVRPEGNIGPGFTLRPVLPNAGHAICRHADRLITYRDGTLSYTTLPPTAAAAGVRCSAKSRQCGPHPPSPVPFATAASVPACHATHGDTLVLVHDGALHYYRWLGQGYDHRHQLPPLPLLEFGLRQAGIITASPRVKFDTALLPPAGSRDPGTTHPSADHTNETLTPGTTSSSSGAQGTALTHCFTDALASEAYCRGLFAMPFLLRYALRDRAGRYLAASPPQLMLPTVLPPRLALTETAVDDDIATARIDMTANRLFALCCRCATIPAVPQEWHDEIAAVDIFVTPQIPTYDPDSRRGYICAYGDMVRSADSGAPNRGRDHSATSSEIFDGHYSIDGLTFADHHLSSLTDDTLHTEAWWVQPNGHLCADIASAADFYRVASLDPDTLTAEFTPLAIDNTSPAALRACRRLDPAEAMAVSPVPDALFSLNGHLLAAGGSQLPPRPHPLRMLQPLTGNIADAPTDGVTITVFSREDSEITATDITCDALQPVAADFPRFIHHPDPMAFMMQISCGDTHYRLPLKPHDNLGGVYWFGGLDSRHTPDPSTEVMTLQSPLLLNRPRLCHNVISVSEPGCAHLFRPAARISVGTGRIAALHSVLRAPGNALPGRFPIYAFTTEGIYLLMTNDELRITNSVKLTEDRWQQSVADIARSIAPYPGGVAYISHNCMMNLSGSKATVISHAIAHPGSLAWLPGIRALALSGQFLYFSDTETYTWHCPEFLHSISPDGLLQIDDTTIGTLAPCLPSQLVTRPIRVEPPLRGIIVHGAPCGLRGIAVYGANHPHPSRWTPIGTSRTHRLDILAKSRWHYIIIQIANYD